jgi:HTH-type transcriptional regulator, competence development regulator
MSDSLGMYLRNTRKECGLTLRAVEEKTGVSNSYLSQLETNKIAFPSPKFLHKLAELYGVSYEHLMKLAGYPVSTINDLPASRIGSNLDELTPHEKTKVQEYIQFLKSQRR